MSTIMAWQEPIIAGIGLPLMIYFELQVGLWVESNSSRWQKAVRCCRPYRWLEKHPPVIRIRSGYDVLTIGWVRSC